MFKFVLYGNLIFDTLEQSSFQNYATCWVFLALRHMLYLCFWLFCIFIFYLCVWHTGMSFLISLNNHFFKNIPHVGAFCFFVICCVCVFVYFVFVFVFVFVLVITVWQKTSSSLRQYFIWQVWVGPWMIYKALEVIQIFLADGRTSERRCSKRSSRT